MVLARHCCSPWTQSSVSSVAALAGVSVSPPSVMARVGFGVGLGSIGVGYLLWGACVHYPHLKLKMSDVIPPNDVVSYPGDQPWHVPFPSPLGLQSDVIRK
ncbi:hypothetical protein L3X38_017758 [Prunus dulcis]|uniref:Uncharacterized protein n=1 Tax=Prunus dulcis TaxID=3755 RepID=A0AAD4W9Q9_PRUDU|nr:hypothetical protein L3X38_017758 [Prunus dulcis]